MMFLVFHFGLNLFDVSKRLDMESLKNGPVYRVN
jgi:hypothetical protein